MSTFERVLRRRLADQPGRPLITAYDGRGGRTELSVTTYANWVAKAASLFADEHDLARGDRLLVDLTPHWLGPVVLGGAWLAGLEVVFDEPAGAVVTGPGSLARYAASAVERPVIATALHPLGLRFTDPLPPGVVDLGETIWSQPDAFVPWDPAAEDDLAVAGITQAALFARADTSRRRLTNRNPASAAGIDDLADALVAGSLVLVDGADEERLAAIAEAEHATPIGAR